MVFSNKVRFPGSWEKEAAPDFVGVAKITVPETADPSAPSVQVAAFNLAVVYVSAEV